MAETLRQIVDGEPYLATMQQRKGRKRGKNRGQEGSQTLGKGALLEEPEEVLEVTLGTGRIAIWWAEGKSME